VAAHSSSVVTDSTDLRAAHTEAYAVAKKILQVIS